LGRGEGRRNVRVFLSYRRDDSAPRAGRLRDALAARFGDDNIFQDIVAIAPGDRFDDAIDAALSQCDASIAVIGPSWITAVDAHGQARLTSADDYVRRELATALSRATPTIPVLVDGALMPTAEQLPMDLRQLALRQAIALHDETWLSDVERLVRALPGGPGRISNTKRLLVAGIAIIVVLSAVAVWQRHGDTSRSQEPRATTPTATTEFNAVTASPPDCPTPQLPDWIDLKMTAQPTTGTLWTFDLVGVSHRVGGTDKRDIIVDTRATELGPASRNHYPFYTLLVDGDRYTPTCFTIRSGQTRVAPGGASEALIGFTGPRQPPKTMTLEVDTEDEHYRLDVTATTTG
jgi:hypothetical protein